MKHLQRGDTIVEVMLAMAIIGAVLGAAFGIANRNMRIAQSSKERTEALKVAESQIELLKAGFEANSNILGSVSVSDGFCMHYNGTAIGAFSADTAECKQNLYSIKINKSEEAELSNLFVIQITWDRIGTSSTEPGELKLFYKLMGS